jgi:phosphatidyl-myo-inositol alpha-mannosyltransferase
VSLRIGMVFSDLPEVGKKPGGVSIVVHELANALVRAKNFVRIYSYAKKPGDALYEVQQIPYKGNLRFSRRLQLPFQISSLNTDDLDVLHLHGEDWAFVNRKIPTVRTFHGCSLNEAKFADSVKSKVVFIAYHPLELWAKQLASFSVGIGDDTVKLLGVEKIIPNGFANDLYYPDSKSLNPSAIVVGTLEGRKQAKLAIEMLLSLKNKIPNLEINAVIDKVYDHPFVQSWVGISREKLAEVVRKSWIGVSTTLYEGFGIYYSEWMAAGTIPITFSNIGTKSLIVESQSGFLGSSLSELENAAFSVFKDEFLRKKYSQNAILATKSLSWDDIARKYEKVYSKVI